MSFSYNPFLNSWRYRHVTKKFSRSLQSVSRAFKGPRNSNACITLYYDMIMVKRTRNAEYVIHFFKSDSSLNFYSLYINYIKLYKTLSDRNFSLFAIKRSQRLGLVQSKKTLYLNTFLTTHRPWPFHDRFWAFLDLFLFENAKKRSTIRNSGRFGSNSGKRSRSRFKNGRITVSKLKCI